MKKWNSLETEVTVDDPALLKSMKELHSGSVYLHRGQEMLFESYDIESQLAMAANPHVHLKNGASLVFDHTEALTVIDVNSAKFTGKSDRQKTVLHVNLAAAEEIARQLRLRGIGGMIVIDFITMSSSEDRLKVTERMSALMKNDPVTSNLHGFSAMGVFEMTRKKERPPLRQFLPMLKSLDTVHRERYHQEALFFQLDRFLRSLQYDESEAIWLELSPELFDLCKQADFMPFYRQWREQMPWKLYFTQCGSEPSFSLRNKGTTAEIESRISKE
jgi:ribonuclease G